MSDRLREGLRKSGDWAPRKDVCRITTLDVHAAGEPLRVVIDGFPELAGDTILARRRDARETHDALRTALMWEPRGHADMYGCLLTPPVSPQADFGVLFTHNAGYSTMCGHGIIAVTTAVLETGILPRQAPETTVRIDTPAGLVTALARIEGEKVTSVRFRNVPSFVLAHDETVEVPGVGRVRLDIAFGGAFYAFVDAADVGLTCTPRDTVRLIETGMAIKRAVTAARPIPHPFETDLGFLYGTIFVGPPAGPGADSRNVCVFAEGEVDRSPTGTGVSARMALHYSRGEVGIGEPFTIESIIGTRFTGRVIEETRFGPHAAVIPEVEGQAFLTGRHTFFIDPGDPLAAGFLLR
jgi:proline racemase